MDLARISTAAELLNIEHPHFGRIHPPGLLKATLGTITSISRKAVAIVDYSSGIRQAIAIHVDPRKFLITIASSFVLVTLEEGASKHPVIHKTWKQVGQRKGEGVEDFFGTVSTYIDSDGLRWEHRFDRPPAEDELIGIGSHEEGALIITLESVYLTTIHGIRCVVVALSA